MKSILVLFLITFIAGCGAFKEWLYIPESQDDQSVGLDLLLNAISESFINDSDGQTVASGKGLYGRSLFYQGKGSYFMTTTCNTWVAKALERAGVPIDPYLTWTAGSVMRQTQAAVEDYSCCSDSFSETSMNK